MPPSGTPVKEAILQNMKTVLETIVAGSDYYTSVQKVTRYNGGPMDMTEFPAIVIVPVSNDYDKPSTQGTLTIASHYQVQLSLFLRSRGTGSDQPESIENFIRDAHKAVLVDRTRNSLALTTFAVNDEVFYPTEDDDPFTAANLIIEVVYRTDWDDLNIAT